MKSKGMSRERKLIDEIQILTIALSTVIIIAVQVTSMFVISYTMGANLKDDARRVADELAAHLSEPLYNIDDSQAIRIAESMLGSGRLSGITLVSSATGTLLDEMRGPESQYIDPIMREITRGNLILGSVTLHYSDAEILATKNRFLLIGAAVVLSVFLVNAVVARMLLKRRIVDSLRSIVDGIGAIGTGDYASRIESSAYSDVNLLVNLLNDMSASILAKNSQLVEATALLEHRVAERTEELSRSLADLQKAQERLIETGKLSALGLLAAGMAHELNTPLGAILSSNRNVIDYIEGKIIHMRDFYRSLTDGEAALYERAIELGAETAKRLDLPDVSRARQREIRERLDSMGAQDPSAVTEHLVDLHLDPDDESLRPLLIEPRADLVLRAVSDLLATRKMAEIIDVAGKKASTVVSALRLYLSPEREDMEHEVDIPQSIENILTLMHNMLKHGVIVRRNFSAAKAKGSADKLGQVWMNIIRNAAQAMDYKGELIIETGTKGPNAVASFIDSGPGIPDHVLARIFEPFFTTKKQGEGMGLGLDICRRIVEAHNGRIEIDARPGRTEFRIILPSI